MYRITVLPEKQKIEVTAGTCLEDALRQAGLLEYAPCGGHGTCGKCRVLVDGVQALACQTRVNRDMTVTLPPREHAVILTAGVSGVLSADSGLCLAVDIGTTTVAAYLTENGNILTTASSRNPQAVFGADVITRMQYAGKGKATELTAAIRRCVEELTEQLLENAGKSGLTQVCVVGNPAMQQLFLGLPVENLTQIPYRPILTKAEIRDGGAYISAWTGARLLIVPDIAGYIGADTVACILATDMDREEKLTLLVDIGTNGEMVLGNRHRLVSCATAAGPALEGAGIQFGMQAADGAIDHVEKGFACHVLGEGTATGICGSGLVDAVAVALDAGLVNERGRTHTLPLTDGIFLTQEDIRQFQQAKGAIAAGIYLMAEHLGVNLCEIEQVYLAGAFGTFLNPRSACRTGLLPPELETKIKPIGNAAGNGAVQIVCQRDALARTDAIVAGTEHLDLATLPGWAKCFARTMRFPDELTYWCQKAVSMGFSHAVPMAPAKLKAREDVRAMCASNQCRAYGRNWTCPPYCGTLAQCQQQMGTYTRGILLQTVGMTRKTVDTKAYRETESRHLQQLYTLAEDMKGVYPDALCLGSGGCRICEACAFPEPCRFPEKACSSMEAYGLFVTDVCRENHLAYHHGENTITYTACILF